MTPPITYYVSLGAPIIDPNLLTITPLTRSRDCLSRGKAEPHVMLPGEKAGAELR